MKPKSQAEVLAMFSQLSAATKYAPAVEPKRRHLVDSVEISLPLPHPSLSPNSRKHWATKARWVKTFRDLARIAAIEAMPCSPHWPSATVRCTFTFPDRRKRDADNLLASMKSAFDGLADAGIVANDSGFRHLPIVITEPDKSKAGVVVKVTANTATEGE